MSISHDEHGWRDEGDEGPYDTLRTLLADRRYQILRSVGERKFSVLLEGAVLAMYDTIAEAEQFAEDHRVRHAGDS